MTKPSLQAVGPRGGYGSSGPDQGSPNGPLIRVLQGIQLMTSEKPVAFVNAHLAAAAALAKGSKDHVAAKHALRVYREAVRANVRRLRRNRAR
jgi:hypothetical protein